MTDFIRRHAGAFQLVFVVAVVSAALLLSATLRPDGSSGPLKRAPQQVPVSIVEPSSSAYRPNVMLNGVVEARTRTDIIPQVGGRVIEVSEAFRPGMFVKKGTPLFRIEPSDYELAVERTIAEIEAARSDLALLEAQSAAEQQIWDQQFPDRKIPDLIAKVPQIAAARARIRSGEAAREAARLALQRTVVRAPFNARVLESRLGVGQVVGTTATVGSLFSVDSLEIRVPVSSDELALIGEIDGRSSIIRSTRLGTSALSGTVVRAAAELDERTRLGTLFVAPDDRNRLVLGEFVNVEIAGQDTPAAYRVPAAALTSADQVWVVSDGVLQERNVDVIGNEAGIAIVRDFDIADGVVAVPPANARAGLPVTVTDQARLAITAGISSATP